MSDPTVHDSITQAAANAAGAQPPGVVTEAAAEPEKKPAAKKTAAPAKKAAPAKGTVAHAQTAEVKAQSNQ